MVKRTAAITVETVVKMSSFHELHVQKNQTDCVTMVGEGVGVTGCVCLLKIFEKHALITFSIGHFLLKHLNST